MRVAVILAGVVLGLGGFLLSVLYLFIIGWGCNGSDASEPPSSGSVGAALCDSPACGWGLLALALAALIAPICGAVVTARRRRYAPLLGRCGRCGRRGGRSRSGIACGGGRQ